MLKCLTRVSTRVTESEDLPTLTERVKPIGRIQAIQIYLPRTLLTGKKQDEPKAMQAAPKAALWILKVKIVNVH